MSERATFLFDGPNFYKNLKKSGLNRGHLNLMKLAQNFAGPRVVGDVVFFTSPTDSQTDAQNYINQQRFFAALQGSGVILKLGKLVHRSTECQHCHNKHYYKTEKSVDVQIAMELVLGCVEDKWDVAYLVTCDADLIPAIQYVRSKGKKVFLLLPEKAHCHSVGNECDATIPIKQIHLNNAQAFS